MGSEDTIAASICINRQTCFEYPIRSNQLFQTLLIRFRNISRREREGISRASEDMAVAIIVVLNGQNATGGKGNTSGAVLQ